MAFVREGADIVLSYLPDEQSDADEVIELIRAEGRTAIARPGDLADEPYCRSLIAAAVDELGGIDLLANIAGKQQFVESIDDLPNEQFDATMRTNIYGCSGRWPGRSYAGPRSQAGGACRAAG